MSKGRNTSFSLPFAGFLLLMWFPFCYTGLYLLQTSVQISEFGQYALVYGASLLVMAPLIFKAFIGTGKAANIVEIEAEHLPTLDSLSTAHWSADEQAQFCKAVDGIKTVDWMFRAARIRDDVTRHHLATALAFAAFSELRRRLQLASDEDLMRDDAGRRSPNKEA